MVMTVSAALDTEGYGSWLGLTQLRSDQIPALRERLEVLQLHKARRLLERVSANPFYGPRLEAAGVHSRRLGSLEDWRQVPVVDKADMLADQAAHPPYGGRLGVESHEVRELHLTSGTSGFGQEVFALADADLDVSARAWQWPLAALGLGTGDIFATMYPLTFLAYGRSLLHGGRMAGTPVVSMAGADAQLAIGLLERLQPMAIGVRPAFLRIVEERLADEGRSPRDVFTRLRGLLCSGLTPEAVTATQQTWNAPVHEVYGSSQAAGIIASTGIVGAAPGGDPGLMYCIEPHYLIETVHPETLEPVIAGEAEVLLTCLDRVASPIVRFRTRDRVTVVAPGTDDNRSPFVGIRVGSIGRYDDMLKIRGNNVWPQQLEGALLAHSAISDFVAEVTLDARGVDVLTVRVRRSPGTEPGGDLWSDLRRSVKRATNVTAVVLDVPDLPEASLKPKRLVDLRDTNPR